MTTRELGLSLHEELDRREKLLAQLQSECDALRTVLGIVERPTPEALNRVTRVIGRRRGRPPKAQASQSAPTQLRCEKCGDVFARRNGLRSHLRVCDGVLRTKEERKELAGLRYARNKRKTTAAAKTVEPERPPAPGPAAPRPELPDPDRSPDAGQAEESFQRIAEAADKKPTNNGDPAPRPAVPGLIYSPVMTCPKCGTTGTRFKRTPEAEYWICEAKKCALKVVNYNIKTDRTYAARMAAGA